MLMIAGGENSLLVIKMPNSVAFQKKNSIEAKLLLK